MFDSVGAFTKQFTPVEGGYLYYPSKKDGGKLVTIDEYWQLTEGWNKVAGRSGVWKVAGIVMVTILIWTIISKSLSLPDWTDSIMVAVTVIGISGRLLWTSFAPRRLVRERTAITPPRLASETKRQARALLNWRFIIFALLFSGIAFLGSLNTPERDFKSWAWLIGSGAMFGLYIWLAIQKFRDKWHFIRSHRVR
ncbi:hypothetical protein BV98_003751 [Sphingobium herbicidovorans NBRC 16415]|uniref:Uncharacterized protein n=1 Tax=Sphingobium herbicidovorans (strain ATCC 700291 / DSM 11019 / CCUG 56400 / KCTC 2939 / LMG 18315 / NBRC 16415 / MH) TaxID=1219045 RepID=A0A086P597_SPHHM|nr:hypothetical protein [Sphingobium herbicidovorans]KFG88565.1 hypothetical protein BV98_003751 [Sphingobium herbicidovorans NBRC 16415]